MTIKARRLKECEMPGRTELYEVANSREIVTEEKQSDGSLDQVILKYVVEEGDVGYFAKEYRPHNIQKTGAKVIDITAVMLCHKKKCIRWHLYDIKDALAGENTVVKLYDQWNAGLQYLYNNILKTTPEYQMMSDLGVVTRCYDKERMERLRNQYKELCEEVENYSQRMTLAQRKKRINISKYRGILMAVEAILDGRFRAESGNNTYEIHIKQMQCETGQIYKAEISV